MLKVIALIYQQLKLESLFVLNLSPAPSFLPLSRMVGRPEGLIINKEQGKVLSKNYGKNDKRKSIGYIKRFA